MVKALGGIVRPGEVLNGPEVNVLHIHVEPRFPSCQFLRFFAYEGVLKIVLDVVRNMATSFCLYQAYKCKGEANARAAKRRIARLNSFS